MPPSGDENKSHNKAKWEYVSLKTVHHLNNKKKKKKL